jgi:phage-related protein
MPLPVFNFRVDANNALRTNTYRTKSVQFGDGYRQLAPAGINNKLDTWNLTLPMLSELEVSLVEAFFDNLGQHANFSWTPPRGVAGIYRLTEPIKYQANGLDRYSKTRTTVTLSIERVYIAALVTATLPIVSVTAVGLTGWNLTSSSSNGISIAYKVTTVSTATTVVNSLVTIPNGSNTIFIPVGTSNSPRTETLEILFSNSYSIATATASILITSSIGNLLSLRFDSFPFLDDNNRTISNTNIAFSNTGVFAGTGCASFDGQDHNILVASIGDAPIIGLGDFTIKGVVKFNAIGGGGNNTPNNQYIFDFYLNTYFFGWYNGNWVLYDVSGGGFFLTYAQTPPINTWIEFAICRSTISGNRSERLYLNQSLVASVPTINKILNYTDLAIGNNGSPASFAGNTALNGFLDSFSISNFAEFT